MSESRIEGIWANSEKVDKPLASVEAQSFPPTGLLRLPLEIRLQIYHYCVPEERVFRVTSRSSDGYRNHNKNDNSLFLLSKQISEEALNIFYRDNIFELSLHEEGEYHFKRHFTETNLRRIRSLIVVSQPEGATYELGSTPDDDLWSSILPQLEVLRIVAEEPADDGVYYHELTFEYEIDFWFQWIRSYLVCFSRHLSGRTVVEVDCDGRTDTEKVIEECLGDGCQKVQCHRTGDCVFQRGEFSLDDDYDDRDYYEDDTLAGSYFA